MDAAALKLVDFSRRASGNLTAESFPYGLGERGVHEIAAGEYGDMAACAGFALAGGLKRAGPGAIVWVSDAGRWRDTGPLSGAGLAAFGLDPGRLLFVQARKPREALWAVEEAMRCPAVALVLAELPELGFTASRRLVLAGKSYGVPVIALLGQCCEGATAATARWRVQARPSAPNRWDARAPGHSRWRAVLERSRSAPGAAGRIHELEFDHETLSLHMVSRLAAGASCPPAAPETVAGLWRGTG